MTHTLNVAPCRFSLIYTQNYYLPDQPGGDENYTSGMLLSLISL